MSINNCIGNQYTKTNLRFNDKNIFLRNKIFKKITKNKNSNFTKKMQFFQHFDKPCTMNQADILHEKSLI